MNTALTRVDDRPYFEKALRYGVDHGILTPADLIRIEADAPKGIVQIADHFGTAYLRIDLETAIARMTSLMSLYLEDASNGDLRLAACSLRDNSLLSHSRGGSEMLKRLHAMPTDSGLHTRRVDPAEQKIFVNERSFAFPLTLASYRELLRQSQSSQMQIDFARWLARQLDASADEYADYSAEEVIRSAMLVLLAAPKVLEFPSRSQFITLIETLRKKTFRPSTATLTQFLREAPEAFASMAKAAMQDFIDNSLPALQQAGRSADEILNGAAHGSFFVREAAEEDVVAYDKLVAKEWVRITRGNGDDPAVLATLFLNIATGQPPKASALLREARAMIAAFREQGFNSRAVLDFIDQHAPFEQREDLKSLWQEDLRPDAEIHLADNDAQMPDSHMERALRYFRANCVASWKGRTQD